MSDENALDQASYGVADTLRHLVPLRIAQLEVQPDSPIERAFLIGLMSFSYTLPRYDFGDSFSKLVTDGGNLPVISVELQVPVLEYRADFLLTVRVRGEVLGNVVIECDGHQFHERTKEQAARDRARDRAMTLSGFKVMRFTGSELHRDLMTCVHDAHYAAWHFYEAPAS